MKKSSAEIAELLKADFEGPADIMITGANSIKEAAASDLAYIDHIDKLNLLSSSNAGCVIIPQKARVSAAGKEKISKLKKAVIYAENPKYAFAVFLKILENDIRPKKEPSIHETAIIDKTAKIGPDVFIGPYAVISENARILKGSHIGAHCFIGDNSFIGEHCFLYPNVTVRESCIIGDNVAIHSGTVIGSDGFGYTQINGEHEKIPQIGKVRVENNVEIGANCAIDRATLGETVIASGSKLDNMIHIAHNVRLGKNCLILAQAAIAGSTTVGDNVIIAGQSGVSDHINIGNNAVVMGRTGIMSDLDAGKIVFGHIGRPHREAMKVEVLMSKLPEMYKTLKKIQKKLEL